MVHCTIELGENYEAVYYPGDLIKGSFRCNAKDYNLIEILSTNFQRNRHS